MGIAGTGKDLKSPTRAIDTAATEGVEGDALGSQTSTGNLKEAQCDIRADSGKGKQYQPTPPMLDAHVPFPRIGVRFRGATSMLPRPTSSRDPPKVAGSERGDRRVRSHYQSRSPSRHRNRSRSGRRPGRSRFYESPPKSPRNYLPRYSRRSPVPRSNLINNKIRNDGKRGADGTGTSSKGEPVLSTSPPTHRESRKRERVQKFQEGIARELRSSSSGNTTQKGPSNRTGNDREDGKGKGRGKGKGKPSPHMVRETSDPRRVTREEERSNGHKDKNNPNTVRADHQAGSRVVPSGTNPPIARQSNQKRGRQGAQNPNLIPVGNPTARIAGSSGNNRQEEAEERERIQSHLLAMCDAVEGMDDGMESLEPAPEHQRETVVAPELDPDSMEDMDPPKEDGLQEQLEEHEQGSGENEVIPVDRASPEDVKLTEEPDSEEARKSQGKVKRHPDQARNEGTSGGSEYSEAIQEKVGKADSLHRGEEVEDTSGSANKSANPEDISALAPVVLTEGAKRTKPYQAMAVGGGKKMVPAKVLGSNPAMESAEPSNTGKTAPSGPKPKRASKPNRGFPLPPDSPIRPPGRES